MTTNDNTCPRCGGDVPNTMFKGEYPGAMSRHERGVEICSECGTDEALRDAGLDKRGTLPRDEWYDRQHEAAMRQAEEEEGV